MKKLAAVLVIVAIATPAMAAVTISCSQVGTGNQFDISYSVTGPNSVRAFALDVSVGASKTITAVSCANPYYYIYPGSIQISGGSVTTYGNCVCDSVKFPGVTQPGLGSSSVTIEMASLYTGTTKPPSSGLLARFSINTPITGNVPITVAANSVRGGITMENPDEAPSGTLSACSLGFCAGCGCGSDCLYVGRVFSGTGITTLTINQSHLDRWCALGMPNCWCCSMQKRGNGVYVPSSTAAKVDFIDLAKVKNSSVFNKVAGEAGYNANHCSDTNLSGKIDAVDLAKIKNSANFGQVVGGLVGCP